MRDKEWVSKVPVRPLRKEIFNSGIKAEQLGVKVIFTSEDTFQRFKKKLAERLFQAAFDLVF